MKHVFAQWILALAAVLALSACQPQQEQPQPEAAAVKPLTEQEETELFDQASALFGA